MLFLSPPQILFERFLILRRIQNDIIKSVHKPHVKYPLLLSCVNET